MKSFKELEKKINKKNQTRIAIAVAEDKEVLLAVKESVNKNLASFHLIGSEKKIRMYAEEIELSLDSIKITDESDPTSASRIAVESVRNGNEHILMKGLVPTSTLLKAVLDKEIGLRTGKILSHNAIFEIPNYEKLLFITDAAMNIAPSLEDKKQIIENSIHLAHSIEISMPKIASIAAVETVNPSMQATTDAALLAKMADRGQINGAIVDGPLGFDNAISFKAAEHKGIKSKVAGQADILLVPNIEVGNALYKALVYFANAKVGAVISGARAPIVLTSRADSHETKLNSIKLAVLSAQA